MGVQLVIFSVALACCVSSGSTERVRYSGHKVLTAVPRTNDDIQLMHRLRQDYGVDLWNVPRFVNDSVMMRLEPELVNPVIKTFVEKHIEHFIAFDDLQRVIDEERIQQAPTNASDMSTNFDFGIYHQLEEVESFIQQLARSRPDTVKLEIAGTSYENRKIYLLRITSGSFGTKPAIVMECGIHAREWSSVATCLYLINELATTYGRNSQITTLLNQYEVYIIPESNPDGYAYTWKTDRLWRKTRSHSSLDWLGVCRGTDANRNFDIEHCGVGTSRKPCDDIFCGDKPFSESEARAIRDLMIKVGNRVKAYFSIHAYSQLWMTPYGIHKKLPPNYSDLVRVGNAGTAALSRRYGTRYRVGSIANIIYEAAGSSVDYAYVVRNIKMSFALELRDTGRHGFFLPKNLILPTCEETTEGLVAAILSL